MDENIASEETISTEQVATEGTAVGQAVDLTSQFRSEPYTANRRSIILRQHKGRHKGTGTERY